MLLEITFKVAYTRTKITYNAIDYRFKRDHNNHCTLLSGHNGHTKLTFS